MTGAVVRAAGLRYIDDLVQMRADFTIEDGSALPANPGFERPDEPLIWRA